MNLMEMDIQEAIKENVKSAGLVDGPYGTLLLKCYRLNQLCSSSSTKDIEFSVRRMVQVFNSASYYNFSLGYGLTGLLWTIHSVEKISGDFKDIFDQEAIVPILEAECLRLIEAGNFDLFHGAHGIMLYLMRLDGLSTEVYNNYITSLKKQLGNGELIPPSTSSVKNNRKLKGINLGIPHGVSGCVLMLARLCNDEWNPECMVLLEKSVQYLLSKRKQSYSDNGYFSYSDHPESEIAPLAWCYGDLSTGYAILKAGKVIQNQKIINTGISILDNTLKRKDFAKKDLSLCHGAPCIAYIYHKAWLMIEEERYRNRSTFWVEITKQLIKRHTRNKEMEHLSMESFFKNQSLIYGSPGMHLSLLTIEENLSFEWDSWMLL